MYELRQVGQRTYYIDNPVRMGIFVLDGNDVCLIDSGNDKSAGKMILRHLEAQGWHLRVILNTHSHADHVGGNAFLQERTGCEIYAVGTEPSLICMPELEPSFLYGGCADKALRGKFVQAPPSICGSLTNEILPVGITMQRLDGHAASLAAFQTADGVWFVGDAVISEQTLEKYHVSYLFNPAHFLKSLDKLETLDGTLFIPSHAEPQTDIRPLVEKNRNKALEIRNFLLAFCQAPQEHDAILKAVFDHFGLKINRVQMAMIGATIRSYLGNLCDEGLLDVVFQDNRMFWKVS